MRIAELQATDCASYVEEMYSLDVGEGERLTAQTGETAVPMPANLPSIPVPTRIICHPPVPGLTADCNIVFRSMYENASGKTLS